jgi:hypothetical protein
MARKIKERSRLLKLYESTGDEDYRRAAECLKIGLLEQLEAAAGRPGRPALKERQIDWPRIGRVHRLVMSGMSVLAAARQEVEEHGHSRFIAKTSAIDTVRREYALRSRDIAAMVNSIDRAADDREWFIHWMKTRPKAT